MTQDHAGELPRVERGEDGHPVWIHVCSAASLPEFNPTRVDLPLAPSGWQWTADGGLTPSILCRNCGVHGFWTGADPPFWRPC